MSAATDVPNIAEALAPILQRVPIEHQPLLVAVAERMAAERYRGWSAAVSEPRSKAGLLACAAREEEIARRVEALYPNAAAIQQGILAQIPELADVNRSLFAPYSLNQQLRLQAQGERLGAATWRSVARHHSNAAAREVFLACATLEEESAAFLESIFNDTP